MKKNKPKGKTPSLIGFSNGKPKKVKIKGRSTCYRCKNKIEMGEDCFGIPKMSSSFSSLKRYCKKCFQNIIKQTEKDLENIKKL